MFLNLSNVYDTILKTSTQNFQVVEANEDIIGTKELEDKIRQQDKIMQGIFVSDDKDKDGLISHPEFSGPKEFLPNTRGIHYDL